MLPVTLPSVHGQAHSNLDPHHHHAVLISLLRGLAAVQVVAAHLRAQFYPSLKSLPDPTLWYQALAFATGFAHQAVVLFFVLSGWLVGGSLLNKLGQPDAMAHYAIDRVTRMWIVLIPAMLLTLLLGIAGGEVDAARADFGADSPYSWSAFLGNLVGVQDLAVPRYGGNFALWSLANEMWYYVLFPLLVVAVTARGMGSRLGALAGMLCVAALVSHEITLFFTLWLMGVGASRVRIDATPGWRVVFALVLAAVAIYFRLTGSNDKLVLDSFLQDLLFSALFLVLLCSLQTPVRAPGLAMRWTIRTGELLASFSFTLYVLHVPLLLALRDMLEPLLCNARLSPARFAEFGIYLALLVAIMLAAWLFHLPFEAQTYRVRRYLRARLVKPSRAAVQNIA